MRVIKMSFIILMRWFLDPSLHQGPSSQGCGFSSSHVCMWEWTIKKAECWKIDAFELWCWRRLLRVPWTARRSNQSILKEISPGCSLEGMMLKLKSSTLTTSCEELTHWKRLWCWEGLGAGGEGDDRGWDGWMSSLFAVARNSRTMLNNSGKSGHPCLIPDLRGNAFSFSPLRIMFAVGLSYMAFTMLR